MYYFTMAAQAQSSSGNPTLPQWSNELARWTRKCILDSAMVRSQRKVGMLGVSYPIG